MQLLRYYNIAKVVVLVAFLSTPAFLAPMLITIFGISGNVDVFFSKICRISTELLNTFDYKLV